MTPYQKQRLTELFYLLNDSEQNDIKAAAKAIKPHIVQLMHQAYLLGWRDSGQKTDPT
jgi:hypothetical protein